MNTVTLDFNGKKVELKATKIIAVARNYRAHADEMGQSVSENPNIFLKPPSAMISNNGVVILPKMSNRVDYEVELAVVIKNRCCKVSPHEALKNILGYTIIVDITARDIQAKAIKTGLPWTVAKGFDTFAPIGPKIVPARDIDISNLDIWLKINGEFRQHSNTRNMIFPVKELISYISKIMTLEPLDVIATGTPEGVGPIQHGDSIEAGIEGIGTLMFKAEQETVEGA
ncbi:acylpyruvase [candidate division TA06 bacterium DG_78]|uniref:Acylpyruvase n=1 Tax=candidate division TA06 bacterium DG_78 TaxID=1703772 RepID=A0A0S7YI40_UNCT6|nr:MAG: acylpyruvase [candidate division TA06 bacterium DG_78]